MGGKRDLAITVVILVAAFLAAPMAIDAVPDLASVPKAVKVVVCFAFSIGVFYIVVFSWAAIASLIRKGAKNRRSETGSR